MNAIFHVTPSGLGGWRVERIGSGEADSFETREEAERHAQKLAEETGGNAKVVVHDARGRITGEWDAPES